MRLGIVFNWDGLLLGLVLLLLDLWLMVALDVLNRLVHGRLPHFLLLDFLKTVKQFLP